MPSAEFARASDPRSVDDLISAALQENDEDLLWPIVSALHYRGSREVFELASDLCRSDCPIERRLGFRILGQLGQPERTFPKRGLALLLQAARGERDPEVLGAVLLAIGHYDFEPESLAPFVTHPDADVRWSLVMALCGCRNAFAVQSLITLTRDADADVRDWATFGLGTQIDWDTPKIRAALYDRLEDSDRDTRAEAIMGLTYRRDRRVLPALKRELESEEVGYLSVEAAEEWGEPELQPLLIRLRPWDEAPLERAIAACGPKDSSEG